MLEMLFLPVCLEKKRGPGNNAVLGNHNLLFGNPSPIPIGGPFLMDGVTAFLAVTESEIALGPISDYTSRGDSDMIRGGSESSSMSGLCSSGSSRTSRMLFVKSLQTI